MMTTMTLMKEVFDEISVADYEISEVDFTDYTLFTVKKSGTNSPDGKVKIPNQPFKGSRFGTCTCGFPMMMGVPCMHMVVALKSGTVDGLNENNFMPTWWMIYQMRLQYPVDLVIKADMDIASLMSEGVADSHIRYCPPGVAPRKSGRPKGDGRIKGALERNGNKKGC